MADLSADPEILHFRPYVSHMDEKGYSEDQPFLDAMPDFVRVTVSFSGQNVLTPFFSELDEVGD